MSKHNGHMRVFLDTEFNGHGGELISMGIAAEDGHEFYAVKAIPAEPHPWVLEHVLPFLHIQGYDPEPAPDFNEQFALFMFRYNGCEVIADWPADFEHFCNQLTFSGAAGGWRLPIECTMRLVRSGVDVADGEIPHNALSDARALRDWYKDWEV